MLSVTREHQLPGEREKRSNSYDPTTLLSLTIPHTAVATAPWSHPRRARRAPCLCSPRQTYCAVKRKQQGKLRPTADSSSALSLPQDRKGQLPSQSPLPPNRASPSNTLLRVHPVNRWTLLPTTPTPATVSVPVRAASRLVYALHARKP